METVEKFFDREWQETTPDKSFYVVKIKFNKDGVPVSSVYGVRATEEGKQ